MKTLVVVLVLMWCLVGVQGCSDDPVLAPEVTADAGAEDAGEQQDGAADEGEAPDTRITSDSAAPEDTATPPEDTAAPPEDTSAPDSSEVDTSAQDTEVADSGDEEDAPLDSGEPTDSALEDTDPGDVEVDVPEDTEGDAPSDTPEDTEVDAPEDVAPDVEPEDTSPDVEQDAEPDTMEPPPVEPSCAFLVNTDAEANNIDGWTVENGEFRSVEGSFFGGLPEAFEGERSFGAGEAALSVMSQTEDLSEWAYAIDAGGIFARFSGHVRTWSGDDEASLEVTALDGEGAVLTELQGGPWRSDAWTWRVVELELPPLTRAIRVALQGDRNRGNDNDAYFDALELCLDPDPAPPSLDDLRAPPYLMWSDQGGVSVRWETAEPRVGRVEYGPTAELGMTVMEEEPRQVHELRLTGLEPGTVNHYAVSWGGGALPTRTFHTAPALDDDAPFSFVVWGDNQNGPDNFREIVPLMVDAEPQFAVSTGDCVQNGTRREYREQLFEPLEPLADHVPFLIGAGNHERYSDGGATLFDEYMSQPGDEHCFGWRWGSMYFMFIDTELDIDPDSPQGQCIQASLSSPEATEARFRAAVFHKPPRIEWWFGGRLAFLEEFEAPWVREVLEPFLESLDVDIVFNGHNHLYAYTPETSGGITWVTTGGAGGFIDTDNPLWNVGDWPEIEVTIHEHHFLSVRVDGDTMTVTAINIDGDTIDQFTVTADP